MEKLLNKIKTHIVSNPEYFTELATEDCPMYAVAENDVILHPVDLTRYENDLLCVILPEVQQDDMENSTNGYIRVLSQITISFITRGYDSETLIKQVCRYAEGLRRMFLDDCTLGDSVMDFQFGNRTFYPDAGTVENQASAIEIELTLLIEDQI